MQCTDCQPAGNTCARGLAHGGRGPHSVPGKFASNALVTTPEAGVQRAAKTVPLQRAGAVKSWALYTCGARVLAAAWIGVRDRFLANRSTV